MNAFVAPSLGPHVSEDIERTINTAALQMNVPAAHHALQKLTVEARGILALIAAGRDHHSPRDIEVAVRQRIADIRRNYS